MFVFFYFCLIHFGFFTGSEVEKKSIFFFFIQSLYATQLNWLNMSSNSASDKKDEFDSGPLAVLKQSVVNNTQVFINCRNNKKLLGTPQMIGYLDHYLYNNSHTFFFLLIVYNWTFSYISWPFTNAPYFIHPCF